jgi:hypothetical protein
VGEYFNGIHYQTLIEKWNGTAWTKQATTNLGGDSRLAGVAATSSTNAWAVGHYFDGSTQRTLIEHWNGTEWSVQSSPNPGESSHNFLLGVAAISDTDAWAVGYSQDINNTSYQGRRSILLHWNGTVWNSSPRPRLGSGDWLTGVAMIASRPANVWAVGNVVVGNAARTLIEHWNGIEWSVVPSPNAGEPTHNFLFGVAATSSTDAWAVGYQPYTVPPHRTIILHWDGTRWTSVGSELDGALLGVAANSSAIAWTVGFACTETYGCWDLVKRWNGRAGEWSVVDITGEFRGSLNGVAITSPNNVWAVGYYDQAPWEESPHADAPLILQWDGTTWNFYSPKAIGSP